MPGVIFLPVKSAPDHHFRIVKLCAPFKRAVITSLAQSHPKMLILHLF